MQCAATERLVETVTDGERPLAILVRAGYSPRRTTFLTDPGLAQQLGFIVYPAGSEIPRHEHGPLPRALSGTPECLVVRRGKTELTLYDRARREVCRRTLSEGDVVLLLGGGHGLRQIEDTVLLEIKPGPYGGAAEKRTF